MIVLGIDRTRREIKNSDKFLKDVKQLVGNLKKHNKLGIISIFIYKRNYIKFKF
jgi:hypothetical protein